MTAAAGDRPPVFVDQAYLPARPREQGYFVSRFTRLRNSGKRSVSNQGFFPSLCGFGSSYAHRFSLICTSHNKDPFVEHLQKFRTREVLSLPVVSDQGWQLKRYAILAGGREFADHIAAAASAEAIKRLPDARRLNDGVGNHGVGFQIIHFAEVAVVSPVFYWQWGSVLASIEQMRAQWETPTAFGDGVKEVVGCVWEMDVVSFEVDAWKTTLLNDVGTPEQRLAAYLAQRLA